MEREMDQLLEDCSRLIFDGSAYIHGAIQTYAKSLTYEVPDLQSCAKFQKMFLS